VDAIKYNTLYKYLEEDLEIPNLNKENIRLYIKVINYCLIYKFLFVEARRNSP
jgi:hypothetical protein